ncbi:MAG: hypothetical protein JNM39_03650 [Bdellovibrionaceae bacterium]|nr:hypothetical protein [Pseudobdellovibrionaceae bacterium]
MKNNLKYKSTLFSGVLVSLIFLGCGNTMQTTPSTSQIEPKPQNQPNIPNPPPSDSKQAIPGSVDVSSFISGGTFDKMQVVEIDPIRKDLIFRLPLGMNQFILVNSGELPDFPGITFRTEILPNGQARLALRVPLKYVLRGVKHLDPKKLPNGDPLPGVPSGEMPGLALTLDSTNKVQMALYLGADFVAIFVESPFDPTISLQFPIKNANGNKYVGSFGIIAAKETPAKSFQGGFFLSYQLLPEFSSILDKYVFP